MTAAPSAPFAIDDFRRDLASQEQQTLLAWADQQLYVAFKRLSPEVECPAVMRVQGRDYHVCSPSVSTIEWLSTQPAEGEPLGNVEAKPLLLAELARNACHRGVGIYLSDGETAFCLYGDMLELWGETAITEDEQGQRVVYRAVEIFTFEGDDDVKAPARGAVQYWLDSTHRSAATPKDYLSKSIHVFDDRLDWDSPLLPDLPDTSRPASDLSPDARAFFERQQKPILPSSEAESAPSINDSHYHNALIQDAGLDSFSRLRAMVDRELIPSASEVSLTIKQREPLNHADSHQREYWEAYVHFITPTQHAARFSSELIESALLKTNDEFPDTIGTHRVSETLRERIVDHVAWYMFHYSRTFKRAMFSNALTGLFPSSISNRHHEFQPDHADTRFPCMAHFCCGPHRLPVLLLGRVDNQYVAQPLEHREIPSADVPSVLPQRSELIDSSTQRLSIFSQDRLTLPDSLVDFPCDAYQGARISDEFLRDKFIADMRFSVLSQPPETQLQRKEGNVTTIAVSVAVIVIVLLAILWFNQG